MSEQAPSKPKSNDQKGRGGGTGGGSGNRNNGGRGGRGRGGGGDRGRGGGRGGRGGGGNNQPTKPAPQLEDEDDADAPEHHFCLICYTPRLHLERASTPCGHDEACGSCHLRLRSLHGDKKCPICKTINDEIIVDIDPNPEIDEHKSFHQYEKWGNDIGPNYTYREDVGMFFPVSFYHSNVLPLFALKCNETQCGFNNDSSESNSPGTFKALANHLATAHSPPLQICDLCITHKRDFVSRLPRYSAIGLKEHDKHGDTGFKNKGHPLCEFCKPKRFYDLTGLHEHLNKEHYECFVCKKMEKQHQFFKDYHKMNLHFDREHYLCRFPECLAARFVVFSNDIDLKAHERDMHGLVTGGSTKITMEFRVRGSARDGSGVVQQVPNMEDDFSFGLDGEVFVPESLDESERQEQEPEITHGPHAERTALLREHARLKREEMGISGENGDGAREEEFPSLGSSQAAKLINWSKEGATSAVAHIRGKNVTALNEENFPSLGGSGARQNNKTAKLRATRIGVNSSFSAMRIAAGGAMTSGPFANAASSTGMSGSSAAAQQSSFTSGVANRNSRANLSDDNFPSLGGGSAPAAASGTNSYAAAQAFAKKNNARSSGMNLNIDEHFPAPSLSGSTQIPTKKNKNVFDKKPAAKMPSNNFLSFPPPPSLNATGGKDMVEGMKRALGQTKYKELKKYTKEFASSSLDPESYVTCAANLFEGGIKDPTFWEFIPALISSCPNESNTKRALRYMESMRFSSGQSKTKPSASNNPPAASTGWASTAASGSASLASISAPPPMQYNAPSAYAASASSRQAVSTGFTGRSLPVTQMKQKNSWNGSASNVAVIASARPGSVLTAAATRGPNNGTATKFMAKEKKEEAKAKQAESIAKQGGGNDKNKKSKAKKNELRDLAFGKH